VTVYRIAKWQEVFERAESRKLKLLTWISMPVSFTSHGYQTLLDEFEEEAAAIYGAWCALCAVAASCPIRGVLSNSKGRPLKVSHIARRTGFQSTVFEKLIAWASSPGVEWLEVIDANEVERLLVENTDFPSVFGTSGESPDEPPTHQGNPPTTRHDKTRPDITKHDNNQTRPDITGPVVSSVCRSVVVDSCFHSEIANNAAKLKRLSTTLDTAWCYTMAWVAFGLDRGLLGDVIASGRSNQAGIRNWRKYVESGVRRACEERGFDYKASVANCPAHKELAEVAS